MDESQLTALRAEIRANPACAAALAAKDCEAIASIISVDRKKANTREIGNGTILEILGITSGNAFLDVLNTNQTFKYVKPLIEQGRLLIGSPLVQTTVQSMVPAVLTQTEADNLCAIGWESYSISVQDVHEALFNKNGMEK